MHAHSSHVRHHMAYAIVVYRGKRKPCAASYGTCHSCGPRSAEITPIASAGTSMDRDSEVYVAMRRAENTCNNTAVATTFTATMQYSRHWWLCRRWPWSHWQSLVTRRSRSFCRGLLARRGVLRWKRKRLCDTGSFVNELKRDLASHNCNQT